jgi:hypothetical protein
MNPSQVNGAHHKSGRLAYQEVTIYLSCQFFFGSVKREVGEYYEQRHNRC